MGKVDLKCKRQRTGKSFRFVFYPANSNAKHFTEIPTIIDPVAPGYFLVALGSIIVGISVRLKLTRFYTNTLLLMRTFKVDKISHQHSLAEAAAQRVMRVFCMCACVLYCIRECIMYM